MPKSHQPQKPGQKRQRVKSEHVARTPKRSREAIDYGVTKSQFYMRFSIRHHNRLKNLKKRPMAIMGANSTVEDGRGILWVN